MHRSIVLTKSQLCANTLILVSVRGRLLFFGCGLGLQDLKFTLGLDKD